MGLFETKLKDYTLKEIYQTLKSTQKRLDEIEAQAKADALQQVRQMRGGSEDCLGTKYSSQISVFEDLKNALSAQISEIEKRRRHIRDALKNLR